MIEQWLYQRLKASPHFHQMVRHIYATMNNLPPPPPLNASSNTQFYNSALKPTNSQRFKAYVIVWRQEMKNSFLFKK